MGKWRKDNSNKIKIKYSLKPKLSLLIKRLKMYSQAKENSRDDQTQKLYNHIKKEPLKNEKYMFTVISEKVSDTMTSIKYTSSMKNQ